MTLRSVFAALPTGFPKVTDVTERETLVIELGFSMRLACSISGNPVPVVTWFKNKVPVDVTSSNRIQIVPRDSSVYCKYIPIPPPSYHYSAVSEQIMSSVNNKRHATSLR